MTTQQTHWDIARMAKTMGMRTTIVLDPNHITPRVKTSIKKQLRAGAITMGWASQAAKIAERIVERFELPVSRNGYRGIDIGHISMDAKHRLSEIVKADWAAMLLDAPGYSNNRYYKDRKTEVLDNLSRESSANFYILFFDVAFTAQAHAVLAELMTDDDRAKIEYAIAALDGNEPIHITTH